MKLIAAGAAVLVAIVAFVRWALQPEEDELLSEQALGEPTVYDDVEEGYPLV